MAERGAPSPGGEGIEPTRSPAEATREQRRLDSQSIPTRLGRYAILRILGEGGMGTVYEAQQENPRRAVALKVIRSEYSSRELLRRFERESQVLGRLQHPGIAQIYEAGTVQDEHGSSRPFIAMEFIRGEAVTGFAQARGLGTRERLELLARICDAVDHAHQKGVIHRDLKPGNILVDESGQPKILDFGIARATDCDIQQTTLQTDIGQLIGTVPYMSPEQVGGDPADLDTRSDVYALGVIAYELLSGRLPYDLRRKMIHEAARVIREEEPTRLSSIDRALRGDVETIVAHALDKDKTRRYQSAESLAADIRRYLRHEPIAARPASTWYQLRKFSRRNSGLVGGVAAAFVLLVAGLIGTSYGLNQAVAARDAAEAQRDKAEIVAAFMADTLQGADPSVALGRDITMLEEMMDAAAARIEKGDLKDAPEAELSLLATIGNTYRQLSVLGSARRMYETYLGRVRALRPEGHPDVAAGLNNLAQLLQDCGDLESAEPLFREALGISRRAYGDDHPVLALHINNLAGLLEARGDYRAAEALFRESLDMRRRLYAGDHADVAQSLNNLALVLHALGELEAAETYCRESLEMRRRILPGAHLDISISLNNLARVLEARGDSAGAEPLYREALDMTRRLFPGDHMAVARCLNNVAFPLQARGDLDGAELLFRESLEMLRRLLPGDHPHVAANLNNLASVLQARGDFDGAAPLLRESLEMRRRLFPGDHPEVARGLNNLAGLLAQGADPGTAESLFREALDMRRRLHAGDHPDVADSLHALAILLRDRGDLADAEPLFREAADVYGRTLGDHWYSGAARVNLGRVLARLGRFADAERELVAGETILAGAPGSPTRWHMLSIDALVKLYGSWDEVEPGNGYGAKRAEWKARWDALTTSEPPTEIEPAARK